MMELEKHLANKSRSLIINVTAAYIKTRGRKRTRLKWDLVSASTMLEYVCFLINLNPHVQYFIKV